MVQECKYNPERDIMRVDPTGYIDIVRANATSSIDVPVALTENQSNGIEDPKSIGLRPSDVFEEMQANRAIVDYQPPKAADAGTSE